MRLHTGTDFVEPIKMRKISNYDAGLFGYVVNKDKKGYAPIIGSE